MVLMIINMNEETSEFPSKLKSQFNISMQDKKKKNSYVELSKELSSFSGNF